MKAKQQEVIFRHKCGGVTYRIHYWWGYLYQSHGYGELTLKALRSLGINYRVNEVGGFYSYSEEFLSSSLGKEELLQALDGYEFPQEPKQWEQKYKELQYCYCRLKYELMSPVNNEDDTFDF